MIVLGAAAILMAVAAIQVPVMGWYLTTISAVLAAFVGGRGWTLGVAAIALNLVNLLLLSPALASTVSSHMHQGDYFPLLRLIGLIIVQLEAAMVLYFMHRRYLTRQAAKA
ncbi:MAG: hypothetical protein HQL53_08030 [Magnetococcales bacterium]|nr:hypothetical protein [Magnetococcales bacterium]